MEFPIPWLDDSKLVLNDLGNGRVTLTHHMRHSYRIICIISGGVFKWTNANPSLVPQSVCTRGEALCLFVMPKSFGLGIGFQDIMLNPFWEHVMGSMDVMECMNL